MALLSALKLVSAKRVNHASPVVQRRNKLTKQLAQQIAMATAIANGTTYEPTKQKKAVNAETGERVTVTVPKRVKQWWFYGEGNKLNVTVHYGAKLLDFGKGKNAIEVDKAELVATLELIAKAVEAGELDAAIEAASTAVRANFK